LQLNGREVVTLKVGQDDFRTMGPAEALQRAEQVDRFNDVMGKWLVTEMLLDRKHDYQLNFYITSERTTEALEAQAKKQPKRSKKHKGGNKKDAVAL